MIFHDARAPKSKISPISLIFSFFFRPNFTFSIVFSTFYPKDGFLTPWDPSQKKDLIFLRRMVPLRPLYDEIWPDSGQFKVQNFKFFGPIRKNMVWTSGRHRPEERKFKFVCFSFIFFNDLTRTSISFPPAGDPNVLGSSNRTNGRPPFLLAMIGDWRQSINK